MSHPHVIVIPYPAQGHVIPFMEVALTLANQGFKVTFVNTEFNHKRVIKALSEKDDVHNLVHLVSVPDGLEPFEDRNDLLKLTEKTTEVMPGKLQELIEKINESDDDEIACLIADGSMGWALEVADKMGIKRAIFWTAAAAQLALVLSIPKLIDDGIINNDGILMKNKMIQLSPSMPVMNTKSLLWACIGDLTIQKIVFELVSRNCKTLEAANWMICNSTHNLEPATFALFPKISPIGPLLSSKRLGHFWSEDSTCLEWLNQQPPQSVIYVAFGSYTVFDETQFRELALGIELTNRPFLWVVRPDISNETNDAYLKGFIERVGDRGRIVGWAPQQNVLDHPSVACFISHCGWNSTMEGISNGIPFLCWPYFVDQFFNESYICDVWKVGLGFKRDERGIISHDEIKSKVEQLLGDKTFKARALDLKEKAVNAVKEGGCSQKNFSNFIEWMKGKEN
ncbi:unnamed protein product [Ilex paraguariensis]|uniref:UDP-glycosyltransferase 83A1 n=1 Tax=Ilex paraguariensis TaxID=185542 RepID=A0ABC8T4G7_9AQUA